MKTPSIKTLVMPILCVLLFCLSAMAGPEVEHVWTNTLGGSWNDAANWSPNGVPTSIDSALITNSGTYTVYATNTVNFQSGIIGSLTGPGTQTLVMDGGNSFNCFLWHVQTNGITVISNATYQGHMVLHPSGELHLEGPATKTFNTTWLINSNGVVHWRGGTLVFNGSLAWVQNDGLWQIECDDWLEPSGVSMVWTNRGILRKAAGTGVNRLGTMNFVNTDSGLVDVQTGTVWLYGGTTNVLGGTFNAAAGATMDLVTGTYFDAGGACTGAGLNEFGGGTLYLQTNLLNGLKLVGGHVSLGPHFQQAGAITNLILDGGILDGANTVAGTLTVNSGGFGSNLTVNAAGHLWLASPGTKTLTFSTLINQGTVTWSDGTLQFGSGSVSNGGLWEIQSDNQFYLSGGQTPSFTNSGTFKKTVGGADMSRLENINFYNLASGIVQVDAGTLRMPQNYTNIGGVMRLNGGRLGASSGAFTGFGPLYMTGGTLEGNGTISSPFYASGGTVAPGFGPGAIQFSSGLTMNTGSTLQMDGSDSSSVTGYDQLSVTGAVDVTGCALQITSLPSVSSGTTFTIIQNDAVDAVLGTFAGLPDNSLVNVGSQSFRLHYTGGTGNDVTLVNESGLPPVGPSLANGGYAGGVFHLLGAGNSSALYMVQATTNFLQWTNIGTATGDVNGAFNFTDTNASKFLYRFYRTTN